MRIFIFELKEKEDHHLSAEFQGDPKLTVLKANKSTIELRQLDTFID